MTTQETYNKLKNAIRDDQHDKALALLRMLTLALLQGATPPAGGALESKMFASANESALLARLNSLL